MTGPALIKMSCNPSKSGCSSAGWTGQVPWACYLAIDWASSAGGVAAQKGPIALATSPGLFRFNHCNALLNPRTNRITVSWCRVRNLLVAAKEL